MDKLTLDISTNKVTTSKMSDDEIKNLTSLSDLEIKLETCIERLVKKNFMKSF